MYNIYRQGKEMSGGKLLAKTPNKINSKYLFLKKILFYFSKLFFTSEIYINFINFSIIHLDFKV